MSVRAHDPDDSAAAAAPTGLNGTDAAELPPAEWAADEGAADTLQTYLREVRRAPLFTPQEEFATAVRARAGDFAARS